MHSGASEDLSVSRALQSLVLLVVASVLVSGCEPGGKVSADPPSPWVLSVPVEAAGESSWSLTGTLHARHEIPLSFRIGGEILERRVDAGDRASLGAVLFTLDPKDVVQRRVAAEATAASVAAEAANAERERARLGGLRERRLASQQEYDRAETVARAARETLAAAEANLEQARNAVDYATLTAPSTGVLLQVTGETAQVVSAGQTIATLAADGPREVEVDVPEDRRQDLPRTANAYPHGGGEPLPVSLREVAGTADPATRTWRARFRLADAPDGLALGTTFRVVFDADHASTAQRVPIGALLDRGNGPLVWAVEEGHVRPVPVTVLRVHEEYAEIRSELPPGTLVVALGVNRLTPGQAVRAREP